jgi:glycosyltransferase involved in cell wall biosynthesis
LEHVVTAANLLRDTNAFFLFVGDGHTKPQLQARARALQLPNVAFVDSVRLEEMPRYYSIAYAAIVPLLRRDTFKDARPSKIFPALASGVPVIFAGEGESAKLLTDAVAGVVAEPESPADLARVIRALLSDPERRDELGNNGTRLARNSFGWPAIVDAWLSVLNDRLNLR